MNRENQKKEYFKSLRYSLISKKVREYKDYPTDDLEEEIRKLLLCIREAQKENEDAKLTYIILFFLSTSLYTKTYKYMLYASDERLYLSHPIGIGYWKPDFIKKDSCVIKEELMSNNGRILALSEAQTEEGLRFILKGYEDIITMLWKKAVVKAINEGTLNDIKINEKLFILAGEYMGELKQIKNRPTGLYRFCN